MPQTAFPATSRLALAAALSLALPVGHAAADTLTIVMESRLSVLDPMISTSHQTRNHGYLVYDTLFALDENLEIQPQMVENYEVSEDGRTYSFTLREGMTWHDGEPVTAADAVASFRRWVQQDRMGLALMQIVDEIDAEDELTFTLSLETASDLPLIAFSKPSGMPLFIYPERVAETPVGEPITDYTGSGPFVFVEEEFQPGARVLYRRFEDYRPRDEAPSGLAGGKVAKVETIERIEMGDGLTALNALGAGEIDFLETIPYDLLPMVEADPDIEVVTLDEIGYQHSYYFNHTQEPFDDKLIRQAAMYAVGQEAVMQTQIGNPDYYRLCGAVFGCGLPYEFEDPHDMVVPSNIERAEELLEEAGYDGQTVLLLAASDVPTTDSVPMVMAQQLRQAGFQVEIQTMDFMTLLSRRGNRGPVDEGGWSIFVTSWHNTEIQDPLRSATVNARGADGYAGWPDVPEIVEAQEEFVRAADEDERLEIAERLQSLVIEHGVSVPVGTITRPTGYRANLEGVLRAPVPVFWNIETSGN